MMARNKEQIITDMLDNGLLSDEDAERYLADKSVSAAELEEIKRLIQLCDNNQKYIDTGQTRPIEELFNEVEEKYANNGYEQKISGVSKAQTLKLLLNRGDISQDEYDKYMTDKNFSDADAMEMKDDYDIIRRGEEGLKNGNVESWEEAIKRIKSS